MPPIDDLGRSYVVVNGGTSPLRLTEVLRYRADGAVVAIVILAAVVWYAI